MENRRGLYYCDYKGCKGTCLIPISGEDCYTLGLLNNIDNIEDYLSIRRYRWWIRWKKDLSN